MRRLTLVLIALAMCAVILPTAAMADTVVDLIAGQHYDVGDVTVTSDGVNLYVKFDITDPDYYLYKTQIAVKLSYGAIPQKNGNAIPGKFEFKKSLDYATSYTQVIPIKDAWRGQTVAIAAHADVGGLFGESVSEVCANLPAQVTEEVQLGTESYMTKTITDGLMLNGVWDGWCVNSSYEVNAGVAYRANVFCSYADPALLGFVEMPWNLDAVNWLMNSDGISMQMKQAAIWKLLSVDPDLEIAALGVDPADPDLAAIVAEALMHDGFKPMKGQYVAVLLNPFTDTGAWVQPNMVLIKIVGDETAWAKGTDFYGSNWSMWFSYDVP